MQPDEIKTKLASFHKPDAWKSSMVWSVWEDGEVTLEKGGDLFGQRNLHVIHWGFDKSLPKELFPAQEPHHARVYVENEQEAMAVREFIKGAL